MKNQMYCLFNQDGEDQIWCMHFYRKDVEEHFLKLWASDINKNWRNWYARGWRIKKVSVKIEIL